MNILVVDDESVTRRILVAHLKKTGHDVVSRGDGRSAWGLFKAQPIPMVITDWMMPGIDGPGFISRIRGGDFPSYTYVILLTGKSTKDDVVEGLESGADDYLIKPINPHELRARVAIGERILNLETRLKWALAHQEHLARHDSLTGLLNRRHFMELGARELECASRLQHPLSAIMLDIDHFKRVNDAYGHAVGDHVLNAVARRCRNNIREIDILGRYGGEEFTIVLPKTVFSTASQIAERLRQRIADEPISTDHGTVSITVSLGVAERTNNTVDLESLLHCADVAMYEAKQAGRNRVAMAIP